MSQSPVEVMIKDENAHQVAQAIYNTVTGKTEILSKGYSENYEVSSESITQLYAKVIQTYPQWEVISRNENITIFHIDNDKQVFSSIERFQIYDKSITSPIESINIVFNVLLSLPNTDKPQPYKISVNINSKIAMLHKASSNRSGHILFKLLSNQVINVSIEYVDYIVARNILTSVESWIDDIEVNKKNIFIEFIQRKSHWFSRLSGTILFIVSIYSCYSLVGTMGIDFGKPENVVSYIILSIGISGTLYLLGLVFGKILEQSVDKINNISIITINSGDKKLLKNFKSKNFWSYVKSGFLFIFLTLNAIFSSLIASYIFQRI